MSLELLFEGWDWVCWKCNKFNPWSAKREKAGVSKICRHCHVPQDPPSIWWLEYYLVQLKDKLKSIIYTEKRS